MLFLWESHVSVNFWTFHVSLETQELGEALVGPPSSVTDVRPIAEVRVCSLPTVRVWIDVLWEFVNQKVADGEAPVFLLCSRACLLWLSALSLGSGQDDRPLSWKV